MFLLIAAPWQDLRGVLRCSRCVGTKNEKALKGVWVFFLIFRHCVTRVLKVASNLLSILCLASDDHGFLEDEIHLNALWGKFRTDFQALWSHRMS